MKRSVLAGIALLAAGALLFSLKTLSHKEGQQTGGAPAVEAQAPITLGRYTEEGAGSVISAEYPTTTPLTGAANDAAVDAMQSWVIETISAFKAEAGSTTGSSLAIAYTASSSPEAASYLFTAAEAKDGATTTTTHAFSFDLATGRALSHP